MGRISQWAVRRPWYALLAWVAIMVGVGVLGTSFGGDYNDNFELPDTESTTAQELLADLSGGAGTGAGLEGQVVWKPESGHGHRRTAEAAMTDLLTELSSSPGVACVLTPYGEPLGSACPERPRTRAQGGQQGGEQPQQQLSPEAEGARSRTSGRPASALMAPSPTAR